MTTLLQEIQTKCTPEEISSRNYDLIASKVSEGRTKVTPTEVGTGTILETLGIAGANQFLDFINNTNDFRYVKPLIEQGRLRIDSPLVQATIQSLVPGLISQAQADALKNICRTPAPVTAVMVANALDGA